MTQMKQIRPEAFGRAVWSGGITEEIYIYPPEADYQDRDFLYRISTAIVEAEQSVFTPLCDYTRYIAPLNGALSLSIGEEPFQLKPFEVLKFDGGQVVTSRSQGGLRDLNLMVRKGHEGSMTLSQGTVELDPGMCQVILRMTVNEVGEFSKITEVWIKPNGLVPELLGDGSFLTDPLSWFAVFTLPEV